MPWKLVGSREHYRCNCEPGFEPFNSPVRAEGVDWATYKSSHPPVNDHKASSPIYDLPSSPWLVVHCGQMEIGQQLRHWITPRGSLAY